MDIEALKKKLKKKVKKDENEFKVPAVSTGSTLLNLAFTDDPFKGFFVGHCYLLIGDSSSGKTALSLTCFAEACNDPRFDEYRIIHDDVEGGALFDMKKLFGAKMAKRLETNHSSTVEDMYYNIDDALQAGKPFIYVVDSTDALDTEDDEKKFQEKKKAHREGKKVAGSYGASKPKAHSSNLRRLMTPLEKTGSILILICQTRDNLGFGFAEKTRSGGKALKFYATTEIWASIKKKIKKKVKNKDRHIGIRTLIKVTKNRVTGREEKVEIPIYYSVGFDDLGSCVDYLTEEGHWKKTKGKIKATEFDVVLNHDDLVAHIEENNLERKLRKITGRLWNVIANQAAIKRKKRYQ